MNRYVVMTAAAQMPASCWGRYRRIAVIELTPEYAAANILPKLISDRARGVARIVETWERLHVGVSDKDAYSRALVQAKALCNKLNTQVTA